MRRLAIAFVSATLLTSAFAGAQSNVVASASWSNVPPSICALAAE